MIRREVQRNGLWRKKKITRAVKHKSLGRIKTMIPRNFIDNAVSHVRPGRLHWVADTLEFLGSLALKSNRAQSELRFSEIQRRQKRNFTPLLRKRAA